ncbi:MAG TPA: spore coat protein U domain-containing protein, partial [Vicinamibacterales bacterium]|nr:spore coat protein U domain-containing protein [Vicinamibacterales bacterium]
MTNRLCALGTRHRIGRAALAVAAIWVLGVAAPAQAKCTISSTSVIFGTYNVFNTSPLDSTGTISFSCGKRDKNIVISLGR